MTDTELLQKIRDYTEVGSTVLSDTICNGFINDAEFRILREVDSDNNRRYATASLVVGQRYIDVPDDCLIIRINYILKPAGLSSTNTTTYLSTYFPNGLLYACLIEAYSFLKGPTDLLQLYEGKYKQVVEGFSVEQMGRRRRDEFIESAPRLPKQL